ncbi:YdcF family protein [Novosphingobium mangrovi (ex Huang et al. 2023)]|uniref:YdcF family protein n=1 Tax=Novosphingobium mangrovi (ex Huang et al. 2023) TaxID=2976432 RepID=A0ABT2I6B2_9SPHN|nr:YdcF family protein [Novosphingobium mangrovi (ex Huang et al. 2023)]MCT2400343.1 YdcF family protein [Novosphingobium mangrovi (ex Huang et al. 2023)]
MFRRIAAFIVLIWLFGFLWFAVALPPPVPSDVRTDAIIVLTGSQGRIEHALDVLKADAAPRLLVSGVDREVTPGEFAAEFSVPDQLMKCCVTLGYQAYDTHSNAKEAAQWVSEHKARSVRLVTADWHMRRAASELGRELPPGVTLVRDAVPSRPSLGALILEYHKMLARTALNLAGR